MLDWLSRLLAMMPVRGRVDLRCFYGAPWRIEQGPAQDGEIAYHVVLSGSAMLEDPVGGPARRLEPGDILLIPDGGFHVMHDGSGGAAIRSRERAALNVTVSENSGTGDRLDLLCGHFSLRTPLDRILRRYLPQHLIVRGPRFNELNGESSTQEQVSALVSMMRLESTNEGLGGRAMLDALSTALFALTLRYASETAAAPPGLLALAGSPRLAPALMAMFHEPAKQWTLPDLARLCHMSRATMARHFQETLGHSASDFLMDIRMALAANQLHTSTASTGAVAEAVGYQSEAAFQRAFKQYMGTTPAQWRRARNANLRTHSASL